MVCLLLEYLCPAHVCVFIWVMKLSFGKQNQRQRALICPQSYSLLYQGICVSTLQHLSLLQN